MRVLISNSFYAPDIVGGAELSVQGIAEQLACLGHEVSVLTTGGKDEETSLNGVRVMRRRFAGLLAYGEHRASKTTVRKVLNKPLTIDNPLNGRIIRGVLDAVRPQVLLSNNLFGITPELWRQARAAGIPIMHTVRDFSLLCPNSTLSCDRFSWCEHDPLIWCRIMRGHQGRYCELVDTVAAPSQFALGVHDDHGLFARARHVVIPNAVHFDSNYVEAAVRLRAQAHRDGALRIVYLGGMTQEKGIKDLLLAMEGFEPGEVELHLAGRGPLETEIQRAGCASRLVFHGFLEQRHVDELLLSCDVLVAPSRCAETFGRVVLDAYRNAMPAIVSDAGALPEVLCAGTGAVFPAGDVISLRETIGAYLGAWDRIAVEGAKGATALSEYTVEHQAQRFERELQRLVDSR